MPIQWAFRRVRSVLQVLALQSLVLLRLTYVLNVQPVRSRRVLVRAPVITVQLVRLVVKDLLHAGAAPLDLSEPRQALRFARRAQLGPTRIQRVPRIVLSALQEHSQA